MGSSEIRKPPCASVTDARVRLVSVQTALIVAPGSTAPVASATVPVMSPVVFWATAGTATSQTSAQTKSDRCPLNPMPSTSYTTVLQKKTKVTWVFKPAWMSCQEASPKVLAASPKVLAASLKVLAPLLKVLADLALV